MLFLGDRDKRVSAILMIAAFLMLQLSIAVLRPAGFASDLSTANAKSYSFIMETARDNTIVNADRRSRSRTQVSLIEIAFLKVAVERIFEVHVFNAIQSTFRDWTVRFGRTFASLPHADMVSLK